MEKIQINIVDDILHQRMALHDYGIPVSEEINKKIENITKPSLVVINLIGVNPMDYEFVNISFKELIISYKQNPFLFIVFVIDRNSNFEELCRGISDILSLKIEDNDTEIQTLEKNQFSMVYVNKEKETKYLSSLSNKHMEILKFIETKGQVDSSEIQQTFTLNAEDTYKILTDLKNCKFICEIDGPAYFAIKLKI